MFQVGVPHEPQEPEAIPTCCMVCEGKAVSIARLATMECKERLEKEFAAATTSTLVQDPTITEVRLSQPINPKNPEFQHIQSLEVGRGSGEDLPKHEDSMDSPIEKIHPRIRGSARRVPLVSPKQPKKVHVGAQENIAKAKRAQWSSEALHLAMEGLDEGYKMNEVCKKYNMPRSSLRDHQIGRSRGRKMGPKTILTKDEEIKLCHYIDLMVEWRHPMTPT